MSRSLETQWLNSDCGEFPSLAQRELTSFYAAVKSLFGADAARAAAEDWIQELSRTSLKDRSARECRAITIRVAASINVSMGAAA